MPIRPGDTLRGKYRLDGVIGRGGMGEVFAACDLETGALVAVKVVSRTLYDEVLMARLRREAEAAALIRSEYVPAVLEVGATESDEVFLVMERLVGESLSARLDTKGTLPWSEVARIGEDVLRGLIDAHTAGVVHRDLKPSNVFLAMKMGRVRAMILDFGVCKVESVDAEKLTTTGEAIGTVAYMAPEQIRGASHVDERADLYAFGAVVFEMLAGRMPHEGPTQMAILASKLENEPARLADHARSEIPAGLDALIARALSRDPSKRPGTAQELLRAWRTVSGAKLVAPTPSSPFGVRTAADEAPTVSGAVFDADTRVGPISDKGEKYPTQTALTSGISLAKGSPGRLAFALAAFGLLAGFVAVVAFFARGPEPEPPPDLFAPASPPPLAEAPAPSALAAPPASSDPEAAPAIELGEAAGEGEADAAAPRRPPQVRVSAPPGHRPGDKKQPRITNQPRY